MKISVVQMNASDDKAANLSILIELIETAIRRDSPDLVALPEVCAYLAPNPGAMQATAEPFDGPYATAMAELAARHKINLHAGSFIEIRNGRYYNTSLVFDRAGELIGRYSKIHRFDAVLPDGTELRESDVVDRGDEIAVVSIDNVQVGLSICYDLRFSELFRKLRDDGASIIIIPAAFTFQTGADHWEVLLRARAIEYQCYVAAPGQVGVFGNGKYMNFGHSMIIDPWGQIVAQSSNLPSHATAYLDFDYLNAVRTKLPVHQHRIL